MRIFSAGCSPWVTAFLHRTSLGPRGLYPFYMCFPAPQSQSSHSPSGVSPRNTHPQRTILWIAGSISPPGSPFSAQTSTGAAPATSTVNRLLTFFFTHHGYLAVLPIKLACPLAVTPYSDDIRFVTSEEFNRDQGRLDH